jgi:hypothetical protein
MKPVIDVHRLPIIDVRFGTSADDAEYAAYLEQMTLVTQAHNPHVVVIDTGTSTMSPPQRKLQAMWLKQHEKLIAAHCRGVAFISTSAVQRFILSSVFLFTSMPTAYVVFKSAGEADAWARQRLAG